MAEARRRTAVLISGRGSNLVALIEAAKAERYPAEIALVVSDNPDAGGLAHADAYGTPATVIDRHAFATTLDFDAEVDDLLYANRIEIVCLAGFMRVLSPEFVSAWRDRILNIHPSLLPAFPGLRTHERALAAGVRVHGASVHFVRPEVDAGPIVAQGVVPILPEDTPDDLAARVLAVEHRLYPMALRLLAGGRVNVVGERVFIDGERLAPEATLLSPSD
jgi:phosphoribosylglycinamide formyltransferase-1